MIVLAACGIALTVQKSKTDGNPGYTFSGGGVITEPQGQIRKKRTIYSMVRMAGVAIRGLQAQRKLLSGATRQGPGKFVKTGGLERAKKDFRQTVDPETAYKFEYPGGGQGIWGEAGDRMIVMETGGKTGTTTVEIIKNLEKTDETIDIITYID